MAQEPFFRKMVNDKQTTYNKGKQMKAQGVFSVQVFCQSPWPTSDCPLLGWEAGGWPSLLQGKCWCCSWCPLCSLSGIPKCLTVNTGCCSELDVAASLVLPGFQEGYSITVSRCAPLRAGPFLINSAISFIRGIKVIQTPQMFAGEKGGRFNFPA